MSVASLNRILRPPSALNVHWQVPTRDMALGDMAIYPWSDTVIVECVVVLPPLPVLPLPQPPLGTEEGRIIHITIILDSITFIWIVYKYIFDVDYIHTYNQHQRYIWYYLTMCIIMYYVFRCIYSMFMYLFMFFIKPLCHVKNSQIFSPLSFHCPYGPHWKCDISCVIHGMDRRTLIMSCGILCNFNYMPNVFIHVNHVLLMFLFICTEINQIKSNKCCDFSYE